VTSATAKMTSVGERRSFALSRRKECEHRGDLAVGTDLGRAREPGWALTRAVVAC
jgi:hypothetical protein